MIVVIAKYSVTPGSRDKVLEFAKKSRAFAITLAGNLEYCAMASPEADEIIAIEKWQSIDNLKVYVTTDACKAFVESRKPYLIEGSKVTDIYEVTPVSL